MNQFPDPAQASARRGAQKVEKDAAPPTAGENPASGAKTPTELICEATGRRCCPRCKCCEEHWEVCTECGGDGYYELYELDPLWYSEDDTAPCPACNGRRGWWTCTCDEKGEHKHE